MPHFGRSVESHAQIADAARKGTDDMMGFEALNVYCHWVLQFRQQLCGDLIVVSGTKTRGWD
ncbi:hypothetical protein [Rhizobium sp. RCC_161_2]|uniref:hypothetical protein n=1 Tax=Rhizobium sp. RCC_161_2 TaxID=3239219 RepID=UPI003523CC8C